MSDFNGGLCPQGNGKYSVILADPQPPWFYNNRKTGGERKDKTKFGGGCRKYYPVMPDKELLDMRPFVDSLANENCLLAMWVTMPRLDFGIELLKGWGFRYATQLAVWVKTSPRTGKLIYGPGYYSASNSESVIIGIRGKMKPSKKMLPSVIIHPRMEHSRKPTDIHDMLDKMYPDARKIELFARRAERPGWSYWGNQAPSSQLV